MEAYQLTYDPFVSTPGEIIDYLGVNSIDEKYVAIVDQNEGTIQKILAKALVANSVSFEEKFHVFLDNRGNLMN